MRPASRVAKMLASQSPVPQALSLPTRPEIAKLASFLRASDRLLAITGAGISTRSGIPDYRSPGRARYTPMTHQDFAKSEEARQRYWARSFVGYPKLSAALPNETHLLLAKLQEAGLVSGIVTQNVDGLHQAAGARDVLELHGSIHKVDCVDCGSTKTRLDMQQSLEWANKESWRQTAAAGLDRPDGDVDLDDESYKAFTVTPCQVCNGVLKPGVVFFGGSIPKPVVDKSYEMVDDCDAVLAVGTTLTVFSVFRLIRRAHEAGKPIAIVNFGKTRCDDMASVKLQGDCGAILEDAYLEMQQSG